MIKLSKRLLAISELVEGGHKILDVGTDHGYLPIYLSQFESVRRIAASDISEGPLSRAKESALKYGVIDKIEFFLSDGLENCDKDFDTIVIAGMGGETMTEILSRATWTVSPDIKLVLQPQSKQEVIFEYLCLSGFRVLDHRIINERGKYYLAISAVGDGEKRKYNGLYGFLGEQFFNKYTRTTAEYLLYLSEKQRKAIQNIETGSNDSLQLIKEFCLRLEDIEKIIKECKEHDKSI